MNSAPPPDGSVPRQIAPSTSEPTYRVVPLLVMPSGCQPFGRSISSGKALAVAGAAANVAMRASPRIEPRMRRIGEHLRVGTARGRGRVRPSAEAPPVVFDSARPAYGG